MSVATLPRPAAISERTSSTPQILWRALWALWICDLLVLGLLLVSRHVHYAAVTTIGKDSAPSIIAAQRIKSSLADMDADAANELLSDSGPGGSALKAYGARRQEAAAAIIAAAQNITYGDAERIPILNIQLGLGTYETLIQRARDLRQERNPSFLAAYNRAAQLLDSSILPAADALAEANLRELERGYSAQRSNSLLYRTLFAAAALLFLATLVFVQLFLVKRTRRLINVPLFAATILLAAFTVDAMRSLNSVENDLKRAKEDAFTSIHALWQARAIGYAANADESRFLLDSEHRGQRANDFFAKRDRLAKLPPNATFESIERTDLNRHRDPGFTGYLADELNNITFPGEQQAALDTLRAFSRYIEVDGQIRALEERGEHRQAIELCIGSAPGQSDWAFQQFDDALGRTLELNQSAFDTSIAASFGALRFMEMKAGLFAAIVAILSLLGLFQRIREYL